MKKSLLCTLTWSILGGIMPLCAQNLELTATKIAQEQIEKRVVWPIYVGLHDEMWIKSLNLEKFTMQLSFKSNGRTQPSSITVVSSYVEPIKKRLVAAAKRVRIPAEMVTKSEIITIDIRLAFENLNSLTIVAPNRYVQKETPEYAKNRAKLNSYYNDVKKTVEYDRLKSQAVVAQMYDPTTYSGVGGGSGIPRFRVTLVKLK